MQYLKLIIIFLSFKSCFLFKYYLADLKFIGESYDDYKSLFFYSSISKVIHTKYFDMAKPSILFIHGWQDSYKSETAKTLINAFLTKSEEYNIIFGDWASSAVEIDYPAVVGTVKNVAGMFLSILNKFEYSYELSKIYIIGHSLGAQIAGQIGNSLKLKQIFIERITGLDPAGPLFRHNSPLENFPILIKVGNQKFGVLIGRSLTKDDALFVDVIHTNAGTAGTELQLGHLDFWPNGGQSQEHCCTPGSLTCLFCSHSEAWKLFAESVKRNDSKFMSLKCPENGTIFTKEECIGPEMAMMGFHANKFSKHGNYFLEIK